MFWVRLVIGVSKFLLIMGVIAHFTGDSFPNLMYTLGSSVGSFIVEGIK